MKQGKDKKWYGAFYCKRTFLLLLLPISFVILLIAQTNEEIAEFVFARGIYKWLSQGLSRLTGILPFSLMEFQLIIFPIVGLFIVIRFVWNLVRIKREGQESFGFTFVKGIINIGCIVSIFLFFFVMFAGVNYYRDPFTKYSGLDVRDSSLEDLYFLSVDLVGEAAVLKDHIQEREKESNERLQLNSSGWNEITNVAEEAFQKLAIQYPILEGNYGAPKPVYFSRVMSSMEITGIYWPFTAEANVNIDVPSYTIPATMLHEMAHLRGFMREEEANFIAYLASKQSDNIDFNYSGVMLALSYTVNELYKQDPELYAQVTGLYSMDIIEDIRESYYYWELFDDTVISTMANNMNDTYLKANNQEHGVKSYGRMVDLLLAEYRKNKEVEINK